ncbi:MAG: helix-turn-helix transcriptional regulator [Spirochaetes bacterium]|nr:helix-turn-helix transcriptional regulator [Spirochaetota bacterium]MBU1080403.1 helix-turn-helix transcriptional regulator [Spirochaetota bacterium]
MPYDDVRVLLARNMKRYRDILRLSQMELAHRVGCSPTMIGNIEIHKRFPSPGNINKIAGALHIHPSELFSDDSPAIDRIQMVYEVRERLEANIKKAIAELLAETEGSAARVGDRK